MMCAECGATSHVLETRMDERNWVWRRRECLSCNYRWKTYEIPERDLTVEESEE